MVNLLCYIVFFGSLGLLLRACCRKPVVRNGVYDKDGKLVVGPPGTTCNGLNEVWQDGKLLRRLWVKDAFLHREDGPAVEDADGCYKAWYKHGKFHREDGPAIIDDGRADWVVNGKLLDPQPKMNGGRWEFRNAEGKLHREDGPAVVRWDGWSEWWLDGEYLHS